MPELEDALKYAYESLKYADIGQKASAHVNIEATAGAIRPRKCRIKLQKAINR